MNNSSKATSGYAHVLNACIEALGIDPESHTARKLHEIVETHYVSEKEQRTLSAEARALRSLEDVFEFRLRSPDEAERAVVYSGVRDITYVQGKHCRLTAIAFQDGSWYIPYGWRSEEHTSELQSH